MWRVVKSRVLHLEFVWVAFTAHIEYLLFASIVTLSGIYDTGACHLVVAEHLRNPGISALAEW